MILRFKLWSPGILDFVLSRLYIHFSWEISASFFRVKVKMGAVCSFENSVYNQKGIRCHNPEKIESKLSQP
jgi:hypothetical protein